LLILKQEDKYHEAQDTYHETGWLLNIYFQNVL